MKKALMLAAVVAMAAGPALVQAQTTGSGGQGGSTGATGSPPQGSLLQQRQGAIGGQEEAPKPVQQGGADEPRAEAEGQATGTTVLPQGSLPAERSGAIGDQPEPVQQGGKSN